MTRINCVPPAELHDKHLLAEYRELPRVFKLAYSAYMRGEDPATYPQEYLLGKGHVKFFYPRLWYLRKRFRLLCREMRARGFKPNYSDPVAVPPMPRSWQQDWEPTAEALALNRQRIKERKPK